MLSRLAPDPFQPPPRSLSAGFHRYSRFKNRGWLAYNPPLMPNHLGNMRGWSILPALTLLAAPPSVFGAESPWRLREALSPPAGFSFGLIHSSRFETVNGNPRAGSSPDDSMIVQRTIFDSRYRRGGFEAQLELYDSRQQLADDDAFVANSAINALEVLQATLRFDLSREGSLRMGRLTTDWGSRRFLARNRFRNAINNFEGFEWVRPLASGATLRLLGAQAVRRLPADRPGLLDNERVPDESSSAQRFYGANLSLPPGERASQYGSAPFNTDLYYFQLREKDTPGVATRGRRLHNFAARLRRPPASGQFDFELESMLQFGDSRADTATDSRPPLDHRAMFHYAAVGYSFPNSLRVVLEFDYASGDKDPFDGENGRFDSLYGVSTFEFGVVGMYQPFSRANLATPGIRLFANPRSDLNVMAAYRHFWLAQERDSWGRTRQRDITGESGGYLGQHLEYRIRWDVVPGNVRIDTGAIFFNGEGLGERAGGGKARYGYLGAVLTF